MPDAGQGLPWALWTRTYDMDTYHFLRLVHSSYISEGPPRSVGSCRGGPFGGGGG